MLFYSYCITWQNTLFFFQKFQLLRKRPVHRLFGWRIYTIKSFSRKDLSAWQGKRCRIGWFSIGIRIYLYTFIDYGWKKELRGWRISVHQSVSRNADEQDVCGEAETSEGFLGAFFKRGVFLFKRWIRISKRRWKDFENLSQDVAILVASFSESCSRICRFLV